MKSIFSKGLWKFTLLGMFLGIATGFWIREFDFHFLTPWIALPGNVFLTLLQMVMVPLVLTSVTLGIASQSKSSPENNGILQLTSFSLIYFTFTTAIAISIGVFLTLMIQPGKAIDINLIQNQSNLSNSTINLSVEKDPKKSQIQNIPSTLLSILPKNPLQALSQANMLSIVVFSLILGIALTKMNEVNAKPIIDLFTSLQEFSMLVVNWALTIAPFAVFGLMAQAVSQIGIQLMFGLFLYVANVVIGLFLLLLTYSMICYLFGGFSFLDFFHRIKELLLFAFSTSSSAAVLPISLETSIFKFNVREKIAEFVIPLGATINMDGTAIYQGIATLFLAQVYGIELSTIDLFALVFTVTAASIGTAASPGVGIIVLAGVLTTFGIPVEGIAIIFGVDRFLDMLRTAVNVSGDVTASVVVNRIIK